MNSSWFASLDELDTNFFRKWNELNSFDYYADTIGNFMNWEWSNISLRCIWMFDVTIDSEPTHKCHDALQLPVRGLKVLVDLLVEKIFRNWSCSWRWLFFSQVPHNFGLGPSRNLGPYNQISELISWNGFILLEIIYAGLFDMARILVTLKLMMDVILCISCARSWTTHSSYLGHDIFRSLATLNLAQGIDVEFIVCMFTHPQDASENPWSSIVVGQLKLKKCLGMRNDFNNWSSFLKVVQSQTKLFGNWSSHSFFNCHIFGIISFPRVTTGDDNPRGSNILAISEIIALFVMNFVMDGMLEILILIWISSFIGC